MKTLLLLLSVLLSSTLFGQKEKGYLVIENKGKTACFFDESDPLSFINMYKGNFDLMSNYYADFGYNSRIYPELRLFQRPETPLGFINYDGNEVILTRTELSFNQWLDSLSNEYETQNIYDDEDRIFESWVNANPGQVLVEPGTKFYMSFDDIHTIIIEYTKSDIINYHNIYFVRDVEDSNCPVISAMQEIRTEFNIYSSFKLSKKENKSLWDLCRSRSFESEECNDVFLRNGEGYSGDIYPLYFTWDGRYPQEDFTELGTQFICNEAERRWEFIDFDGNSSFLYNNGKFNRFDDWIDSLSSTYEWQWIGDMVDNQFIKSWQRALLYEDKCLRLPSFNKTYWWDFPNYSSHQTYFLEAKLDFKQGKSDLTFNDTGRDFGIEMDGNLFLPLISAYFGKELIMGSFERFKDSNTELKWAQMLYNQKAGVYYPDMKKGDRDVIFEMIKTPRGFMSGESDLMDIFYLGWDGE